MHLIQKENLPFIGSSYNFVGAEQGDVGVSMFLVEAKPRQGAPLVALPSRRIVYGPATHLRK